MRVAVIDTGVDPGHAGVPSPVDDRGFTRDGDPGTTPVGAQAVRFHGTAVTSVIAGTGEDGGPEGIAPDAEILAAAVWLGGDEPEDSADPREQVADAVRWAVDSGADVINLSLGWNDPSWPESWDAAFSHAAEEDVLVIACVGNRAQGAERAWSPSTMPGVLGVGGLDRDGGLAPEASAPGIAVDLMAPATGIPVAMLGGGSGVAEGSSFAAPIVAGVAALMRGADPDASAADIAARLQDTAGEVPGYRRGDAVIGAGALDAPAAMASSAGGDAETLGSLEDWIAMHRQAEPMGGADDDAGLDGFAEVDASVEGPAPAVELRSQTPFPWLGAGVIAVLLLVAAGVLVWSLRSRATRGR